MGIMGIMGRGLVRLVALIRVGRGRGEGAGIGIVGIGIRI